MSKLRKKLSKWFLDTAKKLDESTVYDNCTIPIPSRNEPFIVYDQYHVDKIHAQHQIANVTLDSYKKCAGINAEDMICRKLIEAIADEIFKNYAGDIKKTQMADSPYNESTLYSLDVYVCKPTKKETI
jgi:hypothetical protein